ncbi:MAG: BlaI/MecI/CopY family transcriptional regulator [Gemmatimonadales bacterium]|nr:BlaI/MecI/CopY family transcriptional regulator [Gemmatimonadales bacterium]
MYLDLGQRERQIIEALYQAGRATVAEVRAAIPDPPTYSAVRTMLGKLEAKGLVRHLVDGPRYVYLPTTTRRRAQTTALRRVLHKLFNGSAERTVAAVLDLSGHLPDDELDRLEALIDEKRRGGTRPKRR